VQQTFFTENCCLHDHRPFYTQTSLLERFRSLKWCMASHAAAVVNIKLHLHDNEANVFSDKVLEMQLKALEKVSFVSS